MNQCIFCQYATDRSDVLRKHYQRHHPTPDSVCNGAKSPRIAVIHPTNPKVAIPLDPEGKMLKMAYCWNCWHQIDNPGHVSTKQGGMAGYVDRNHTCREKQIRPKRGSKKPVAAKPVAPVPQSGGSGQNLPTVLEGPHLVVQEVAPVTDDNPFRRVVLELLEDKQVGPIIREELPEEPDSEEESDSESEPISSKDVLKAAIYRSVKAMDHVRKASAKIEPLQKELSRVTEERDIYREQCQSLERENEAIAQDAERRITAIRIHAAECREEDLQEMAAKKDAAILALVARLAEATGQSERDILEGL
jgi:hypothetical protein